MPDALSLIAAAHAHAGVLRKNRIVLYAGANYPRAAVVEAYAPALSAMPSMGPSFAKEQPGTGLVSELEVAVAGKACALFHAQWAEPRLPSATFANLAVFHAFAAPGDILLAPAAIHGGHLSQRGGGTPDLAGLVTADLPFDTARGVLDAAAAARQVRSLKPRLVMLGRSVMLSPDDIAPVTAAARAVRAITIFDASHVAGLIAGGTYPNPLDEGVDILTASTYKTIAGRPHGLVVGRNPRLGERLARLLDRALLANYDAGTLPQVLLTLSDMEQGAADYARRIVANTAALAAACAAHGLPVHAATDGRHTHQLLIPIAAGVDTRALIAGLERQGVIVGISADIFRPGEAALRLGTQLLTTWGLTPQTMAAIAALLADLLIAEGDGVRGSDRLPARQAVERVTALLAADAPFS